MLEEKCLAADQAHLVGEVGVGGQSLDGLCQTRRVARLEGQTATHFTDQVGRLAVSGTDEKRRTG